MRSDTAIITSANRFFDPLNPDPAEVSIEVVAHALSMICRFTGHLRHFYSVAQHSVHVAEKVIRADIFDDDRQMKKAGLTALLHDASEAYIADVSRPVKQHHAMETYRAIERRIQHAVYDKWQLRDYWRKQGPLEQKVKDLLNRADLDLLGLEAQQLGGWDISTWDIPAPGFSRDLFPLPPLKAKELFMQFYTEMTI